MDLLKQYGVAKENDQELKLTESKPYGILKVDGDNVEVLNDNGEKINCSKDKFYVHDINTGINNK